jgi:spermidine/putrescine-binding protein
LKKIISLALSGSMLFALTACGGSSSVSADAENTINVFNWGEYIDESLLTDFENQTGIHVVYNYFDSNESMYAKLQTESYDVIIPSDYMIARLIDEDMLQPLNFDNIPNMELIDEQYTHLDFDPDQLYSVPYTWGVVGIIYNTKYVDEADLGSWDLLWNDKYAGQVAMFDNSRDALGLTLRLLGYSQNTTDESELRAAADKIIEGKDNYQGFWMDQILEKLPNEEIVAAPYYNGDAVTMMEENSDLSFYIPKEGTNLFVDAMCIPKNAQNVAGAEAFINFMCSTEAASANADYIGYSSPQREVYEAQDEDVKSDPIHYPDLSAIETETFLNLPEETLQYYTDLWTEIKK